MLGTQSAEMGQAVGRLKQLSADERARMLYEARELYLMDERARINAAWREGEAKGHAKGEAAGIAKGERKAAAKTAEKMLQKGFTIEDTAEYSGLPLQEVRKLKH